MTEPIEAVYAPEVHRSLVNFHRFLLTVPDQPTENNQSENHHGPPTPQLEEQDAIRLLQEILIGPFAAEIDQLSTKVDILEQHVLDPTMGKALQELQSQISDQSAVLSLRDELQSLSQQQQNIPLEIQRLTQKVLNLEYQLHEPEALMELLLPLLNDLIERKVLESGEEFARATAPVLDEMIRLKITQDKSSMGKAIAPVVTSAIGYQMKESPGEFATVIASEMNLAIKEQVRANASSMIDALYPIMGSTIAKYIAELLRNINTKIERAITPEGLIRKVRARLKGISEAELILKESVAFQVQAVFLIQKLSGLVISEAQPTDAPALEGSMIGGMLTAIRGFVHDCIVRQGDLSELDRVEYGNSIVWLEGAGSAYLAVVLMGEPPRSYLDRVRRVMRILILDHSQEIECYEGNNWTIPPSVRELLDSLIPVPEAPPRSVKGLSIVIVVVSALLLVPWGWWQWQSHQWKQVVQKTQSALVANPQLSIYQLDVGVTNDRILLAGRVPNTYLRDLAVSTAQITNPNYQIENKIVSVEIPPDPLLTQAEINRLTSLWQNRVGVKIKSEFAEGILRIQGTAPDSATIQAISQGFSQVPGVSRVITTLQVPAPNIDIQIFFATNVTDLKPEDSLKIQQIKDILDRYPQFSLTIIGQSDGSGSISLNQELSLARARSVENALIGLGVSPSRLKALSSPPSTRIKWNDRRVTFELISRS